MKIVGLISSEEELNELETIAKIFVLERRMKKIIRKEHHLPLLKQKNTTIANTIYQYKRNANYQLLNVRGFH